MDIAHILRCHAKKYSLMQPTDAVKLIYQNEFGGGHLITDEAACMNYLHREYSAVTQSPSVEPIEDIGNGLVRVMLSALDCCGYSVEQLGKDFIFSAAHHKGKLDSFLEKLNILRQLVKEGVFSFSESDLEDYLLEYEQAGYPAVSHSPQYRRSYAPAYRIVLYSVLPEEMQARVKK